MSSVEIRHFHLFSGLGGAARGFSQGAARVDDLQATYRCIGGVDSDPAACRDFEALTGAPATLLDLFDEQLYRDFHGEDPPADWRPATVDDIRRAAGGERPHIVFTSPPCKGFSGLIPTKTAASRKYQALNHLTLRGVMLALAAWEDDLPEFFMLENVPRIQNRGRDFIDQIRALLEAVGYSVAETVHDCGELGGLAQTRQRFLMVARHREKVPPFLYEPPKRPLRSVGEILGPMPLPGDPAAGPLHAMRQLEWRTWVRLALIPAGGDWRDLRELAIEDGVLRDFAIVPDAEYFHGAFGVQRWEENACTVTGRASPSNGKYAVADPRYAGKGEYSQYGVQPWDEPTATVTAQSAPGGGRYSVADPRLHKADTAGGGPSSGGQAIADPRLSLQRVAGDAYWTQAHYGVLRWDAPSGAVTASARHDNGRWNVADPRAENFTDPQNLTGRLKNNRDFPVLPGPRQRMVAFIRALDGTWHRPFTTLELAALQGLVDPDMPICAYRHDAAAYRLELDGSADTGWRQRIGNAVPPPAAAAVASAIGHALLLAWTGQSFALSATPIWARELAVLLSLETPCPD